jgi:hypothetical protein
MTFFKSLLKPFHAGETSSGENKKEDCECEGQKMKMHPFLKKKKSRF